MGTFPIRFTAIVGMIETASLKYNSPPGPDKAPHRATLTFRAESNGSCSYRLKFLKVVTAGAAFIIICRHRGNSVYPQTYNTYTPSGQVWGYKEKLLIGQFCLRFFIFRFIRPARNHNSAGPDGPALKLVTFLKFL